MTVTALVPESEVRRTGPAGYAYLYADCDATGSQAGKALKGVCFLEQEAL
jgi:hypothetical protein